MKKTFGLALAFSLLTLPAFRAHAEMTMEQAGEKAMGLIEGIADIVAKDKDNCATMATDLEKYQADNAALIKELNSAKAKRTADDRKAWQAKYQDRLKAAQAKMMSAEKCSKDEKVKAAFEKMK